MLVTVTAGAADDAGNGTAGIRLALLLAVMAGTCIWWYRRSTGDSRRLAAAIRKRGAGADVAMAPLPVAFGDREAAVADGVDLTPLQRRGGASGSLELLSIARETLSLVRKARAEQIANLADGLLSDELRARLDAEIAADARALRHHLFPMLDIAGSSIIACSVTDDRSSVTIRHTLTGAEVERSDETGEVTSGDAGPMLWDERWTFERPVGADGAGIDRLKTHTSGGWLIPHRGWVATAIEAGEHQTSGRGDPVPGTEEPPS